MAKSTSRHQLASLEQNDPVAQIEVFEIMRFLGLDRMHKDPRFSHLTGKGIKTVLMDSGVPQPKSQINHRTRADNTIQGSRDDTDDLGHASLLASILAGKNSMSPLNSIIPIKIFGQYSRQTFAHLRNALEIFSSGSSSPNNQNFVPDIINLSISDHKNYQNEDEVSSFYPAILHCMQILAQKGVILVCASGNRFNGKPGMGFPAISKNCISVGAIKHLNERPLKITQSQLSIAPNGGTDIFAPGHKIPLYYPDQSISTRMTGTSVATAFVSSAISLLKEYHSERKREDSIAFDIQLVRKLLNPNSNSGEKNNQLNILNIWKTLDHLDQIL